MKILTLCFNTQSVRLAESLDPQVLAAHRQSSTSSWIYNPQIPDFWMQLSQKIQEMTPNIVAIGFQEDVKPGSYFHSHFLPIEMEKLGFSLFERTNLMGVGQTCFDGLLQADLFVRGLRLSVYIQNDLKDKISKQFPSATYTDSLFQNKGASAIYLTLPDDSVLAIINCHLPFDSSSLKRTVEKKDHMIRQDAVFVQNQFYNEIYRRLYKDSVARPKYLLFMGDFNYRISPFINWSARQTGEYILQHPDEIEDHDELKCQMRKGNIYMMNEGPLLFAPTCKMNRGRTGQVSIESFSLGENDQRVPSYCDRILYLSRGSPELICLEYDRFDHGMMKSSDHAGVLGIFSIS